MTLRRLFVGTAVVFGLSVWSWCRADGPSTPGPTADPVCSASAEECGGGNHDEAAHRYRTNQSRHWRHVMIGNH